MADPADVAARHAEHMRQQRLAVLQQRCTALAATIVNPLDEKDAASDWHRWLMDIRKVCATTGEDFQSALLAPHTDAAGAVVNVVPKVAAAGNLLDDDFFGSPQPPEMRQLAIRSLIGNSLIPGGEAQRLIKDKPHAGGSVDAAGSPDPGPPGSDISRRALAQGHRMQAL